VQQIAVLRYHTGKIMKHVAGKLLLIAIIFFAACKKDNVSTQLKHDITGSWELSKAYVTINIPGSVIDYVPGNGNIIAFGSEGQLSQTTVNADTTYTTTGKYNVQKEDNCGINLIIKEDSSGETDTRHISVHNDTLTLGYGSCIADAPTYVYLRKK
jgi:hypothetical protein